MTPKPFTWQCPIRDGGSQGGSNTVSSLFGGKRSLNTGIFVREDMQNHVDAKRENWSKPVEVKIAFKDLPSDLIQTYFPDAFREHIFEASLRNLDPKRKDTKEQELRQVFASNSLPVLVIEDFGTTGLNGPVNTNIADKNRTSSYYHPDNALTCFFQRSGESGKTGKKLGSAGLGRHVYYMASKINTKFIYTVPSDSSRRTAKGLDSLQPRPLFFGQSLQEERQEVSGTQETLYENYLSLSPGKELDERSKPYVPFGLRDEDAEVVEKARQDFRLDRMPEDPGLSIVIPFPRDSLTPQKIIDAIAKYFAIPILEKRLDVFVGDKCLDAMGLLGASEEPKVNNRNLFLVEALTEPEPEPIEVSEADLKKRLNREMLSPETLSDMARRFADGQLVHVASKIRFGPEPEEIGTIRLYAKRTEPGMNGQELVARTGLEIANHSDKTFSRKWNSLVYVRDDNLGQLLRDSETPSHDDWIADDILEYCPAAHDLVTFVTTCGSDLIGVLTSIDESPDDEFWADLFPTGGIGRPIIPETPAQPLFSISLRGDGQTAVLATTKHFEIEGPSTWDLEILYDTIRGNRRRAFRPGSFDLAVVEQEVHGGEIIGSSANNLRVRVDEPDDFRAVIGPCAFSSWPDLHVRVASSEPSY